MITRALSVDQNIAQYVNSKLKRDLLKLCGGVGAFSETAMWQDPCLSFVLSQVSPSWAFLDGENLIARTCTLYQSFMVYSGHMYSV